MRVAYASLKYVAFYVARNLITKLTVSTEYLYKIERNFLIGNFDMKTLNITVFINLVTVFLDKYSRIFVLNKAA